MTPAQSIEEKLTERKAEWEQSYLLVIAQLAQDKADLAEDKQLLMEQHDGLIRSRDNWRKLALISVPAAAAFLMFAVGALIR